MICASERPAESCFRSTCAFNASRIWRKFQPSTKRISAWAYSPRMIFSNQLERRHPFRYLVAARLDAGVRPVGSRQQNELSIPAWAGPLR